MSGRYDYYMITYFVMCRIYTDGHHADAWMDVIDLLESFILLAGSTCMFQKILLPVRSRRYAWGRVRATTLDFFFILALDVV